MTSSATLAPTPDVPAADGVDIKCVGLVKTFRDFWMRPRVRAVEGVDLEVRRGEVFGLLGPNGSGKSTTIKMLLGLLTPTSGRIAVLGRRPRHVQTKKFIGYLPEESYLYRFLSARETLDFYGRLFRIPAAIRRERVDMLLSMVGLEAVEHRPVGEFSKGMQRRVGLAQSLINDPQLLILDEPTSGMDPIGARQIKDVIASLAARGKTILLCTHLLSDVEDLCSRVAIMYGGKVRAEGTIDQLLQEEHLTSLETDSLPADALAEVRAVLERRGLVIKSVAQPRRRLESLFLEIVDRARKEGLQTSGARNGGAIAGFLRPDAAAERAAEADGGAVLEQLTARPTIGGGSASASPAPASVNATPPAEADPLARLTAAQPAGPGGSTPETAPPAAVDQGMLDSLVRKP
ncbi:MAG: ABC transporter ATP-binding protein [Planctomycetia bacterium]|jgi:ABC-2 type transport system ATP-binding protein